MMNQTNNISSLSVKANQLIHTVVISKDFWLGEWLDDYLFKLCGTDEVIWIPKENIRHASHVHNAFEIQINENDMFSCARLTVSNCIRMWLVNQHQVRGKQVLPYLRKF